MRNATTKQGDDLTRRRALGVLVGAGSAVATRCRGSLNGRDAAADAEVDAARGGASAGTDTAQDAASCAATPEGEIGPFFVDDSESRFNRSNVLSNIDGSNPQLGVPLTLTIIVLDGRQGCAPYVGAQVDIWHCNASGIYSDEPAENTPTETWLRGYQLTDKNGQVIFQTIIPGWYSGRTTHIHLRVRSAYNSASSMWDGSNTTQLFFVQSFIDRLPTAVAPYDKQGINPTTNALDQVFSREEKARTCWPCPAATPPVISRPLLSFCPSPPESSALTCQPGAVRFSRFSTAAVHRTREAAEQPMLLTASARPRRVR